jgi:hypothetical protein
MDQLAVHHDFGAPLGPAPIDPDNSGSAAGHGIPPVLRRRGVSQVCNAIVRPLSVPMINFGGRMLAMDIEPRKPMREMRHPIDSNLAVSAAA